uniref:Serine/threonine-protein phosphatase n=1 Tax=Chromera velia CCMP2878 TaxID=1169474 RepID=A0A0G4FFZ0_9ALVE|mmetsp:Transcript_48252/g.95221  ORF Transcript_48252/g.95221 Transcript_48252/m.95221 type:complete len:565 (+) Transcript_48252:270-1964(+)|eukprot:Cvel_3301.t1-p1 / transcript=Cvel_3301.t1 / gene=Cvel_3301 / organism=Chromera_velia_CCMP2878 / gene_product=Serine/threonine-protein phosphatase 5, putative / transcript_product=Serine/threonine-protein phosphatase 5, putative / location=Cvel_scaffold130:119900-125992(+) / protein_length=564 / sequence_SO=supercontig / SO=protein_coding / is_pseudo=false
MAECEAAPAHNGGAKGVEETNGENGVGMESSTTDACSSSVASEAGTVANGGLTHSNGSIQHLQQQMEEDSLDDDQAKEIKKRADKHKEEGNVLFKAGHYVEASEEYTSAILICTEHENDILKADLHIYFSNRAFCQLRLENFGSCIVDAERALQVKPSFTKAAYRRGCAYMLLSKWKLASKDFTTVFNATKDKDAELKMKECQKMIKQQKFAEAIRMEKAKPISETIEVDHITVAESYDGPRYQRGESGAEFLKELLAWMKEQKTLHKRYAYEIVLDAINLLKQKKALNYVTVPEGKQFTVCGDVHGQFYDLLNIFEMNGLPSEENPYLFNGDFVDRGSFSVECTLAVFAAMVIFPSHFHLNRGNHETKNMNKIYGFEGEVKAKYDQPLYDLCAEAFCLLPLSHVLNKKVFVTHGGLFSKDDVTLNDIEKVDRDGEPPDEGLFVEMLWSDPQVPRGRAPSKRGVGVAFGPDVTANFLEKNGLDLVVRSHEMKPAGYEVEHGGKLVTVFSAPNYCDQMGNQGAFMRFTAEPDGRMSFKCTSFDHVPHPPVKAMAYAKPFLASGLF